MRSRNTASRKALAAVVAEQDKGMEVVAMSRELSTYEALVKAQVIMSQLAGLAATPMPESYLRVDEEPDVVALDKVIKLKHMEWRKMMDEPRVYPEPFR